MPTLRILLELILLAHHMVRWLVGGWGVAMGRGCLGFPTNFFLRGGRAMVNRCTRIFTKIF